MGLGWNSSEEGSEEEWIQQHSRDFCCYSREVKIFKMVTGADLTLLCWSGATVTSGNTNSLTSDCLLYRLWLGKLMLPTATQTCSLCPYAVFSQRTVSIILLAYGPPPDTLLIAYLKRFLPCLHSALLTPLVYFFTILMPAEVIGFTTSVLCLEWKPSFCHVLLYLCKLWPSGYRRHWECQGREWWRDNYYLCCKHCL